MLISPWFPARLYLFFFVNICSPFYLWRFLLGMDAMCLLWPIVSNIWTRSVLRKRIFEMDSLSIFLGIGISIYFLVGFGWVCIIESTLNWFLAATLSKRASVGNVFLSPSYQRSYSLSNCPFIPFTRKFTTKWPGIGVLLAFFVGYWTDHYFVYVVWGSDWLRSSIFCY